MVCVRSLKVKMSIEGGIEALMRGSSAMISSTISMTLAPGCLKMTRKTLRLPSAQAACVVSCGLGDRLADVAHPQRGAVAVGDDDVVPVRRPDELIVGVDREGARSAVDRALGLGQRRDRERRAHILERQPFGDEFGGIELDANGGLLLAADAHLGDAGDLTDLLGELGLDIVVDLGQRQEFRGRGEQENRRIRRVHLAVSRRTRQILRQLSAGGVDRRLDVGRRRVDVCGQGRTGW